MTEVPFYRCMLCQKAVSPWDIKAHRGCPSCGHARLQPTNLTLWEKVVQIMKHPAIWRWGREASL